jgi:serine/threonine protein kinase
MEVEEENEEREIKKITPLNDCSVIPNIKTAIKEDCLKSLANYYAYVRRLGTGVNAMTVEVARENHQVAVKILKRNRNAVEEIQILCRLNELRTHSHVFGEIYGWTACRSIPGEWTERMRGRYGDATELEAAVYGKNKGFVFIAMELNSHRLVDLEYTEEDLIMMFFLLLHGIAVARRKFPYFRHRDIHSENIMIQLITPKGVGWNTVPSVNVNIANKHHVVLEHLQRVPRLIDFGEARFQEKPHANDIEEEWNIDFKDDDFSDFPRRNDLYRIGHVVIYDLYKACGIDRVSLRNFINSQAYENAMNTDTTNFELIEKLLEHEYFKIPTIKWKPHNYQSFLLSKCSICSSYQPTLQYDTHPHIKFCDTQCESSFSIWKHFLPISTK